MITLLFALACAPHYPGPTSWIGRSPQPVPPAEARALATEKPAVRPSRPLPPRPLPDEPLGVAIASSAQWYLSHTTKGFRNDCSGFVAASAHRAGVPIQGSTADLWDLARQANAIHHRKLPRVGDLAFFDDTYDRDRNGRWDDALTHVAVVTAVSADGHLTLAHAGTSKGKSLFRMNLKKSAIHRRDDVLFNDYLRTPAQDPDAALASRLWRGFATLHQNDLEIWTSP